MRLWLAVLGFGVLLGPGQPAPTAADLARQVQAHYTGIHDFTADFAQTLKGGVTSQTVNDRGTVRIKKPGRMLWDYATSQKQRVVADGTDIYIYLPEDRKLYVTPLPKADEASKAMLFLSGRGDLTRDFTASLDGDQPPGQWRLKLVPKVPDSDFTTLTLVVNRASLSLEGLITTDQTGGVTTYAFSKLKENVGLKDSDFVFDTRRLPKDVEVIR
ncbi:MAG TPA: outer membrane lipoprotein carrier protein LolA [Vicinamibacterales bacterium]|nr:outer membrane lipoprotein carrier protein LolA [Vicinamibacterales bacterium]